MMKEVTFNAEFLESLCRGYSQYYERKYFKLNGDSMPGRWKDLSPNLKQQSREAMEYAWRFAMGALNDEEDKPSPPKPEAA